MCCLVAVLSSKLSSLQSAPLYQIKKVASNNDVSLFEEFISRNSYFSGILEIIQKFPQCTNTHTKDTRTHTYRACVTAWKKDINISQTPSISFPKKNRHQIELYIYQIHVRSVGFCQETTFQSKLIGHKNLKDHIRVHHSHFTCGLNAVGALHSLL